MTITGRFMSDRGSLDTIPKRGAAPAAFVEADLSGIEERIVQALTPHPAADALAEFKRRRRAHYACEDAQALRGYRSRMETRYEMYRRASASAPEDECPQERAPQESPFARGFRKRETGR